MNNNYALYGNWILGDGGPNILIPTDKVSQWQGARDYEQSIMNGGNLRTHYDIACEVSDWLGLTMEPGFPVISLHGDDTMSAWLRTSDGKIGIVRPIFQDDSESVNVYNKAIEYGDVIQVTPYDGVVNQLSLLVAADVGESLIYGASEIQVCEKISTIETKEYKTDGYHLIVHLFK